MFKHWLVSTFHNLIDASFEQLKILSGPAIARSLTQSLCAKILSFNNIIKCEFLWHLNNF